MQPEMNDRGGAIELARYRLETTKRQIDAAREVIEMVEEYLRGKGV